MSSPQKALNHIASHSSQSDHTQFHVAFLSFDCESDSSTQMADASAQA
jgi:hypothetical protein